MPVIPTGFISSPLQQAKTLLAATAAYQAWVGAANSAEAEQHIYLVGIDGESLSDRRPYCLIVHGEPTQLSSLGSGVEYSPSGAVLLGFEANTPEAYLTSHADAEFWFTNAVGGILQELWELSRSPLGYLWTTRLVPAGGPWRSGFEEARAGKDYQRIAYFLEHGLEG